MSSTTKNQTAAGSLEEVSALLRAATSDPALRKQIIALIRLPSSQRSSIIKSAIHEMALRGEPEEIRSAFGLLATDEGAAVALQFLSSYEKTA